jgi:hypothetical protein
VTAHTGDTVSDIVSPSPVLERGAGWVRWDPTSDSRTLAPTSSIRPEALLSTSASVVAAHRTGLVYAPPARPVQYRLRRGQDAHDQPVDQPPDLGDGERDEGHQAVVGGQPHHQRHPPLTALPGRWERTTVK